MATLAKQIRLKCQFDIVWVVATGLNVKDIVANFIRFFLTNSKRQLFTMKYFGFYL